MRNVILLVLLGAGITLAGELSESDAVRLLLANNPDIVNAAIDVQIAEVEAGRAGTILNPQLSINTSRILGDDYDSVFGEARLDTLFASGTMLSIAGGQTSMNFDASMIPDTSNRAGSVILRQALLRNAFGQATRNMLRAAAAGPAQARLAADLVREEMVLAAVSLYWEWVYAAEAEKMETDRHAYYRQLYDYVVAKRADGAAEERDEQITRSALLQSAAALKQAAFSRRHTERMVRLLIVPDDPGGIDPVPGPEAAEFDVTALLDSEQIPERLTRRTDLRLLEQQIEQSRRQSAAASSNSLPLLDVVVGYSSDAFMAFGGGAFTSYLPAEDAAPGYMGGISFAYVFGGDTYASEAERVFLDNAKLKNRLRHKRQEVMSDYADSIEQYRTAREVFELTAAVREVSRARAAGDARDLKLNRVTFEAVVEAEDRYVAAHLAHIRAWGSLRRAIAELRRNSADLLKNYTVETETLP